MLLRSHFATGTNHLIISRGQSDRAAPFVIYAAGLHAFDIAPGSGERVDVRRERVYHTRIKPGSSAAPGRRSRRQPLDSSELRLIQCHRDYRAV